MDSSISSDDGIPIPVAAVHDLPLDASSALPYVIRTGEPQFISSQEDYLRRWPHGVVLPYLDQLDSGFALSIGGADRTRGNGVDTVARRNLEGGGEQSPAGVTDCILYASPQCSTAMDV